MAHFSSRIIQSGENEGEKKKIAVWKSNSNSERENNKSIKWDDCIRNYLTKT